ncbi:MAG: NUDIX hydrolase [Gammaproteobacteria bacterium]
MTDSSGSAPVDAQPRPAASILLLRDAPEGKNGNQKPEVFLVKRSSRGPFPNLHVFPGGKLDAGNDTQELERYCLGLDDLQASARLQLQQGGLNYWLACVRECFEEAGILIASYADGSPLLPDGPLQERLNSTRKRLNAGETGPLLELCRDEDLRLRLDCIAYSAHWITPEVERKRFDTRFFVAALPAAQQPVHDGHELIESRWMTPEAALEANASGAINLIMPTIANLKAVCGFNSALDAVDARHAEQDIPAILPKFVQVDGQWKSFLPGDLGYDAH